MRDASMQAIDPGVDDVDKKIYFGHPMFGQLCRHGCRWLASRWSVR